MRKGIPVGRAEEPVPTEVRAFVHAHIPSVGHMEALVLTMEDPDQQWTVQNLAGRLFVPEERAGDYLRHLATSGLVEGERHSGQWRFAPRSEALEALARRARHAYRRYLKEMTGVIHTRPG